MKATLIDEVLDWPRQHLDFEDDGALRDIYVQDATIADWKAVVAMILAGDYRARIQPSADDVQLPTDIAGLFWTAETDRHFLMSFAVGGVLCTCHFFARDEIEFSFGPDDVTEPSLRELLGFMVDIGQLVSKTVILTPENVRESPLFTYDAREGTLRWHGGASRS